MLQKGKPPWTKRFFKKASSFEVKFALKKKKGGVGIALFGDVNARKRFAVLFMKRTVRLKCSVTFSNRVCE